MFTELLTKSCKHFFEIFNGHLNWQKNLKKKIPKRKREKLAYTNQADNIGINYS